jgi:plastocyanin
VLRLPLGYGYRVRRASRWTMHTMLMSHSMRSRNVYVQYRVRVVTGRRLAPVHPFWVRASGCRITYPVWGGGGPESINQRTSRWRVPVSGRIVAAGGHLHGGAKDMWLGQPACGSRRLVQTAPRYGRPDHLYYRARPILHEPGPIETGYFLSRTGIPVRRGENLTITGTYDNAQPHPRVMSIMHVYVAPGRAAVQRCPRLPSDARTTFRHRRVRTEPPAIKVPLNIVGDDGRTRTIIDPPWPARALDDNGTVHLRSFRFSPPHVAIKRGATVNWSFDDAAPHNLTFANGPRLIRGPTLNGGRRYSTRFTVPGRYELFCYLHPVTMHEVVDVSQ